MNRADPTIQWLLQSGHPSICYLTLVDLLDKPENDPEVQAARSLIVADSWVSILLAGQEPDGGFGVHPYQKWTGAHWRLVSLVELGIPEGPRVGELLGSLREAQALGRIRSKSGAVAFVLRSMAEG